MSSDPGSMAGCDEETPGQCRARAGENLMWIRSVIERVDAHLDAHTAPAYRDQPLAGHWSRVTKVCSEAGEVMDALSAWTGENPRKGVHGTRGELNAELADTACAALFAIQHLTKDAAESWAVFLAALARAMSRVPGGAAPAADGGRRGFPQPGGTIAEIPPGRGTWDPVPDLAALIDGLRQVALSGGDPATLGVLLTGPYARLRGGLLLDEPGREAVTTADAIREALRELA